MTGEKINRRPPKKCLTRVSKKQSIVSEIKSPRLLGVGELISQALVIATRRRPPVMTPTGEGPAYAQALSEAVGANGF